MASYIPMPSFFAEYHLKLGDYLVFDLNIASIHAMLYLAYYFMLEPVAAVRRPPAYSPSTADHKTYLTMHHLPHSFCTRLSSLSPCSPQSRTLTIPTHS